MKRLAPLAFAAALLGPLAAPALAQYEGAAPTRDQQEDLLPLVRSISLKLELHVPSVSASDVERLVRKALFNQNSNVALKRYEELVVELLIEDLGVSKDDENAVRFDVLPDFGKGFGEVDEALVGGDETFWKNKDKKYLLLFGAMGLHAQCVRHNTEALWTLRSWNGKELDGDQERGIKELAKYYEDVLAEAFGVEKPGREFGKLLLGALSTDDTDRAVLATLGKLRFLIRPAILEELEVGDSLPKRLAARSAIDARLQEVLADAEFWPQLRADHEAMIEDAKEHRKVLRARGK